MATTQKARKLALGDVQRTLTDDRHLGFGYAGRQSLSPQHQLMLDGMVRNQANRLGLDYEQLFAWSNSKPARWLADVSIDDEATGYHLRWKFENAVAKYLTAKTVAEAMA